MGVLGWLLKNGTRQSTSGIRTVTVPYKLLAGVTGKRLLDIEHTLCVMDTATEDRSAFWSKVVSTLSEMSGRFSVAEIQETSRKVVNAWKLNGEAAIPYVESLHTGTKGSLEIESVLSVTISGEHTPERLGNDLASALRELPRRFSKDGMWEAASIACIGIVTGNEAFQLGKTATYRVHLPHHHTLELADSSLDIYHALDINVTQKLPWDAWKDVTSALGELAYRFSDEGTEQIAREVIEGSTRQDKTPSRRYTEAHAEADSSSPTYKHTVRITNKDRLDIDHTLSIIITGGRPKEALMEDVASGLRELRMTFTEQRIREIARQVDDGSRKAFREANPEWEG